MVQVTHLLAITVITLFRYSSELEFNSEESTFPERLTAVVPLGKRLKLSVKNVHYPALQWRFNGEPVSEKCETEMTSDGSNLICTDMDWSDAGLYECRGFRGRGQKETLLIVDVKIAECTEELAARQRIALVESVPQKSRKCFCSEITDQCSMADDLFRSQITANVTERDLVDLKITENAVEEFWTADNETESSMYYVLPNELKGNLLKSYGGYMDFPSTDNELDEDKPDLVLLSKSRTLVYFDKTELVASGELGRKQVHMTEQNWRQLNNSAVSRDTFLTVLSNVKVFYVKFNQQRSYEPIPVVLDSADTKDHGLGKVTTVEKCNCRPGYKGLSCESCSRGFFRRSAVLEQGICVSLRDILEPLALGVKNQLYPIQNKLKLAFRR